MADEIAPDAAESKLFDMAAKMDAGEQSPKIETSPTLETPAQEPAPEPQSPDAPPVEPAKATRERGPDGKFLPAKKAEVEPVTEGEPPAKVVESDYAKKVKEQARQENLLKNFEEKKIQVRQREEAIQRREQELAAAEAQNMPRATLHGYTADEYRGAANEFAKNGDHERAFQAIQAAAQVEAFEQKAYAEQNAKATDARYTSQMVKVMDEHPELKDPESRESKMVKAVLGEYEEVYYLDHGFEKAYKLALRLLRADSADDFESKLKAAEAELTKLRDATTPSIGGPSAPAGTKKFSDMTPAQQEAHLERQAAEMDAHQIRAAA